MKSLIIFIAALFAGQVGHATEILDSEQMTKIFLDQDKVEQMVELNANGSCGVQEEVKRLLKLHYYRAPVEKEDEIKANIRYIISQLKSCDSIQNQTVVGSDEAQDHKYTTGGISGASINGTHRVKTFN